MKELKHVGSIINRVLSKSEYAPMLEESRILDKWPSIIGEKLAPFIRAKEIEKGILYLTTNRSTWSIHIHALKEELIKKVNESAGKTVIKNIKINIK